MRKIKTVKKTHEPRKTMVFKSGNSLAVRLPKAFHFSVGPVLIFMRDDEVVIRKAKSNMSQAFKLLTELPDDFMKEGRNDLLPQKRKF
ncbi:MAG: AbrB/MazE/SpoVT family DNA-binding domain-containing protein [Gammaproteobacteria bacterium]|nr:AbrB/MazE/SpoVT family DNA-binding domain-containing protein [Gammaproteobacteria bacterium]